MAVSQFIKCSVRECNRIAVTRDLCEPHYRRLLRWGDPKKGKAAPGQSIAFLENIIKNPTESCVIWPYGTDRHGYGRVVFNGRTINAARAVLIMATGHEQNHLEALHGPCNNRLCVNPLHIRWGTTKQNAEDRNRDGTGAKGTKNGGGKKLTEQDVMAIYADQRKQCVIANEFGVTQTTICSIKRGRMWWWLTGATCTRRKRNKRHLSP